MDGRESDWGWPYSHLKVDQRNQLALELNPRHQAFSFAQRLAKTQGVHAFPVALHHVPEHAAVCLNLDHPSRSYLVPVNSLM